MGKDFVYNKFMSKIKVGVLRGGPSHAYDDSLKTGGYVLSLLRKMPETYEPVDLFVSRNGDWHSAGLVTEPHDVLSKVDVVWNAVHGPYGEDGQVQKLFDNLMVPYIGPSSFSSALSYNKDFSKKLYTEHSLLTPRSYVLSEESVSEDELVKVFHTFVYPVVVKPATGSRALGVRLAHTFQELKDMVKRTLSHAPKVLVEEYVKGRVSTCTVIEDAKGERLYALLPTGRQPVEVNKKIEEMAKKAHEILGQRHFSSSDFIITPRGKVYILETNSVPVFYEGSHLHQSLESTGWQPQDFVEHCMKLTLKS